MTINQSCYIGYSKFSNRGEQVAKTFAQFENALFGRNKIK